MEKRFVIIGGDAAGMSAASKARREDPDLQIIVFEKSPWASYGACGFPYYIKGDINNLEDLVAIPPEIFIKKRNIDLRLNNEVIKIIPESKQIVVKTESGETKTGYDKLLISTGAKALRPNIDGIDLEGVFTLRDMDSARIIKEYLQVNSPESALIVGGGYIGMEMAEAFHAYGVKINIVELLPHVLNSFGPEIAEFVEDHIKDYTKLYLGKYVHSIKKVEQGKLSVQIKEKEKEKEDYKESIHVDMVLVAAGITPEVSLAEKAGIALGPTGAIATDEYGQTNIDDIYAAGDCAEVKHMVTGKPVYIPLALTANRNGRAIGSTIGGKKTQLVPIAGTAVVKVFQLEVATTGIVNMDIAQKNGFNPIKVTVDSYSRAGYCPRSKPIKINLIADKKSKQLLGASMVGEEGVVKRIDTISTSLSGKFTVKQLENLDLAYAPPFSPVWDPVLTAARVLNGKLD
jgi:CoA-dependent NAD(P)H sulfur oxidoreductase